MNLRGSLFIKVFFGFWVVTLAVLGSWMLTDSYFQARLDSGPVDPQQRHPGPPQRFVLRMIYQLQHTPGKELPATLEQTKREHGVDIFLLRADGSELLGRDVPQRMLELAGELSGIRRRAARAGAPGELLLAHEIYRPEDGPLRAVFRFRQSERRVMAFLARNHWLRLFVAVTVSGLLCFFLSRLVTGRLQELSQASRRLARGELGTRLAVRDRGGDETDELARDFNDMAEQLQDRIQAQRRLLQDVSHELRSPLARLRVALALAQDSGTGSQAHLQRIEQETERLEQLIGELLSSQAEEVRLEDRIDLAPLLEELCRDARFEFEGQDKEVQLSCTIKQAVVAATGDLLRRSFENILRNAMTHTAAGTRVCVALGRVNNRYKVTFTDRGPGVPEAELERIFDEFYRLDTARTRETGGYGLGLAIARRGIEQHGGSLSAQNTGNGLSVSVSLPMCEVG